MLQLVLLECYRNAIAYGGQLRHRTFRNTKRILHFYVFQHLDHRFGYQNMGIY
ncbi:hypothetical protein LC607_16510 [Nostoc sp. CHAB 5824]|nr:hypothetical protein [Nostoc sp. CHAB 5824]